MEGTPASGRLRQHWRSLIGFVLLTLTVELIASYFSVSSVESWYRTLEKPSFNPPDGVFGPV